ncbi:MAG: phenylalanine--tRNA ligase subunit beta [Methylohalobius crimeensis]
MRFSEAWLREYVDPPVSTARLVEQLTMAGLEVDSVDPAAPDFSGLVVAQVVALSSHPNADKLRVCQVSTGAEEPLQIVCGAPNVYEGMKAPLAVIGAQLPGGFKIKKSKLRGVESYGMLCSASELGLAESSQGLWELPPDAPVGEDIRSYLQLDDTVIDVDLTPNRADCLSVEGVAREAALLNRIDWRPVAATPVAPACDDTLPIRVEDEAQAACPRYLGRLIRGVDAGASTPLWMQERLRRSGIRSLGPLVDITNYVLLELGQPLHAFDAACLRGDIQVRMGRPGEKLVLLGDQEIELTADSLVIADDEHPLALAGVMGGQDSAVGTSTRDIFLECAFFAPEAIMGRARRYGLHTDSSHRFERGVDPALQARAMERATRLILEIAGGESGPVTEVASAAHLSERPSVRLRSRQVERLLGMRLEVDEIEDILRREGCQVEKLSADEWRVQPPSFRFDLAIEADLIEELARVYGYSQLPVRTPALPDHVQPAPEGRLSLARIQDLLADHGFREAITYSFVDRSLQDKLAPDLEPVAVANPLSSEMGVMRTTLWTGLLNAALYNFNRQQPRVRLFESGLRFYLESGKIRQEKRLAALMTGPVAPEQWSQPVRLVDFYDAKAEVEALLSLAGRENDFRFRAAEHPALHPGQTAALVERQGGQHRGWLGMLHPALAEELGFDQSVFLFELDGVVLEKKNVPTFQPLSKYPSVRRDLALVVPERIVAQDLIDSVSEVVSGLRVEVLLFDVYRGKGLAEGEKSLALGLVLQDPQKTLTDADIEQAVAQILQQLADKFQARLRGE